MLTRELPKTRDLGYFLLLVLHHLIFLAYHRGRELELEALAEEAPPKDGGFKSLAIKRQKETTMKVLRRNKCRMLFQETLKGLAKGLNMSSFVLKGIFLAQDNALYFLLTLIIRGVLSSIIKSLTLAYVLKVKKLKVKKTQLNLLYHVLPSALLYFTLRLY